MSTLKVNKLRDTSGSTDAITLDPNGGAVLAGVTTISTARITTGITTSIQVGGGVTISESGIEASGIGITCANINGAQIGGRRNIVINGAMEVAQRGITSTSDGIHTVDRFKMGYGGENEVLTQAQVDVSSGTSPYTEGFRKAFKITNGNQTGGLGAGDYFQLKYTIEAQDIAKSGWNYTSSSSFITLSFWIKSSVAQNFYGYLKSQDGTFKRYVFETGSLSANTWTKVVKTVPGNAGITFNNDTGEGLILELIYFAGTDETGSVSLNSWATFVGSSRTPDNTATWWTTNDATLEVTGVQLEVGSQATPFEHRSFGEELQLCSRYFQKIDGGSNSLFATGFTAGNDFYGGSMLPMGKMRAAPTIAVDGTLSHLNYTHVAVSANASSITNQGSGDSSFVLRLQSTTNTTSNAGAYARIVNSSTNLTFAAEL